MARSRRSRRRFVVHAGVAGRLADAAVPSQAAFADVGELDAPASLTYALPVHAVEPEVTTVEAFNGQGHGRADRGRITLSVEDRQGQKITSALGCGRGSRSRRPPTVATPASIDTAGLPDVLKKLAKKIDQAPVNASFKTSGGRITGVTPSKNGYKIDVDGDPEAGPGGARRAARRAARGKSIEPTAQGHASRS